MHCFVYPDLKYPQPKLYYYLKSMILCHLILCPCVSFNWFECFLLLKIGNEPGSSRNDSEEREKRKEKKHKKHEKDKDAEERKKKKKEKKKKRSKEDKDM